MAEPTSVERASDFRDSVSRWDAELEAYEHASKRWYGQCARIVQRYRLEGDREYDTYVDEYGRPGWGGPARFNILWANTRTLRQAVFGGEPKPIVHRRYSDEDPVGRLGATVLERAVSADLERDNLLGLGGRVTDDTLLCGRGVPWVRFEPGTETMLERAPMEYVHWSDFAHAPMRTWEQVRKSGWVARAVRMTRDQGVARFGAKFENVPLEPPSWMPEREDKSEHDELVQAIGVARVWEVWGAQDRKARWLSRAWKDAMLDERDDPLKLDGLYPCPMPAYGTLSNESLIPTPDFLQYRKLADELDIITERISVLTEVMRLRGVYDETVEGLARLLSSDAGEADMIGVANFSAYLEGARSAGRLGNVVQFVPLDMVAAALQALYDARDRVKQVLFEVSGLSDIVRGESDPREKATTSRLKASYAEMSLSGVPTRVQECMREAIELKCELIAEHFDPETIKTISAFSQIPEVVRLRREAERAVMEWEQAAAQAQVGEMPEPLPERPPDPEQVEAQAFEAVMQLLRTEHVRGFRISVETDATMDEEGELQRRMDFLNAMTGHIQHAVTVLGVAPQLAKLIRATVMFAVRAFRAGRSIESEFDDAMQALVDMADGAEQAAEEGEEEGPTPEEVQAELDAEKARIEAELVQLRAQAEQAKIEREAQAAEHEAQLKAADREAEVAAKAEEREAKARAEALMHELRMEHELEKLELERARMLAANESAERQAAARERQGGGVE